MHLSRALTPFMQVIIAGCAEGHQALLTFQGRLQNTTVLAGNLQVAEIPMEQHVGLLEQQPIDRGLCAQRQFFLFTVQHPLTQWYPGLYLSIGDSPTGPQTIPYRCRGFPNVVQRNYFHY